MYLIVGLGNIGDKYDHTRHNVGFDALDFISEDQNISISKNKFKGTYGEGMIDSNKVMLLKPSTYMNLSGESVSELASFYKIDSKNIIVIQDDISLPIGKIRIRQKGSHGGHNGIKNIIQNLNTDQFVRIKIGVGQPNMNIVSYVLGKFEKDDRKHIEKVFKIVGDVVKCIIIEGVPEAMNKFNGMDI
ncbi:aminoacyl-tRNA hydrolase [Clostridium tyrobutyricum]|jgi:PTH1 family peptidyl-tRNA hydrolase|uniref:aminoacyl-tRNA hydrolase n=1 Tax=Clostridium tyrobutyricum TaxID=1519 RepID=UPI000300DD6E|nr:aminoacyl-tRNA hydrolase [Clostridium tyrobutyricum]MBV4426226.1 aminoacyl-tRNA hydrolase [Clostridium tyrobutyricum]MBV4431729.1 aminoacyl-tRNA hydrolase [Clostridium tyrobutyricum]MBV4438356.1 aminoacyl-tRNA hydrolase [Clostridium tyrobutyricum]MBV4440804.1 aminoacyl-tRNA hydrolase [Clostridium tyrobutyricum]MBV4447009.1 aminoacyl-tRNA hydrolase [Clostridium tyrobutyricum]